MLAIIVNPRFMLTEKQMAMNNMIRPVMVISLHGYKCRHYLSSQSKTSSSIVTHHRMRVFTMFNTWVSLSLLHTGYKETLPKCQEYYMHKLSGAHCASLLFTAIYSVGGRHGYYGYGLRCSPYCESNQRFSRHSSNKPPTGIAVTRWSKIAACWNKKCQYKKCQ